MSLHPPDVLDVFLQQGVLFLVLAASLAKALQLSLSRYKTKETLENKGDARKQRRR